jgi:hypothetical protein
VREAAILDGFIEAAVHKPLNIANVCDELLAIARPRTLGSLP